MGNANVVDFTGSRYLSKELQDLRDVSKSLMRIHHPTSVREVIFSPSLWQPLQALVGLDNGSIYRFVDDLLYLDFFIVEPYQGGISRWDSGVNLIDCQLHIQVQLWRLTGAISQLAAMRQPSSAERAVQVVSAGLLVEDSTAVLKFVTIQRSYSHELTISSFRKVWNLTAAGSYPHIPHKADYALHPSFPVRRVLWRPDYDCELAVVSNEEFGTGSNHELAPISGPLQRSGVLLIEERGSIVTGGVLGERDKHTTESKNSVSDACEIWDVRRGWIAKWSVTGSAVDGGVTGE
jgi:hypothetical protein